MSSTPLALCQQKEQIDNALKETALGDPKIEGFTIEDLNRVLESFEPLLSWDNRMEVLKKWRNAYIEQQKSSPGYVRSLLELKNESNQDVTEYREEILNLLKTVDSAKEVKAEWFTNATRLKIEWTYQDVGRFPIQLVKEYIQYLSLSIFASQSQASVSKFKTLKTEIQTIEDPKLRFKLEKFIEKSRLRLPVQIEDAINDSDDEDEYCDGNDFAYRMKKENQHEMTSSERLLILIALHWDQKLRDLSKDSMESSKIGIAGTAVGHWIYNLLQAVYKHTVASNKCPPGCNLRIFSSDPTTNRRDLIQQIQEIYLTNPISAIKQDSRRQMAFRYGSSFPLVVTQSQCSNKDNIAIEFPYLCYVIVDHVEIFIHDRSYLTEKQKDPDNYRIVTGSVSIPLHYRRQNRPEPCDEAVADLIKFVIPVHPVGQEELSKYIQVESRSIMTTIHDIRVYGKAVILM